MSDIDAFLRELAAFYLPDYRRVLIETQEQCNAVNATLPKGFSPYRVGDVYMERVEKPLRLP